VNVVLIHLVVVTKTLKLRVTEVFVTPVIIELASLCAFAVVENTLVSALLLIVVTVKADVDSRVADGLG